MDRTHDTLAITGWGVLSAIGTNRGEFTAGFWEERSGLSKVDERVSTNGPFEQACWLPTFDVQQRLGKKGTRSFDRTTAMTVTVAGEALAQRPTDQGPERHRIGTVLGTSTGSIKAIAEYTRESLVNSPPYLVNPATFPNTVMNCAAGQTGIWHKVSGINATLSAGKLSAFAVLQYSTMVLRCGYSDLLIAGAVEEYSDMLAWAYKRTIATEDAQHLPLGEGCAMFMVELDGGGRPALARVRGVDLGFHALDLGDGVDGLTEGVARCIGGMLDRAGLAPSAITAVSKNGCGSATVRLAEDRGIERALGGHKPAKSFTIAERTGDTFSASGALQVAGLLALFEKLPPGERQIGLATVVGGDGQIGGLLLERGEI